MPTVVHISEFQPDPGHCNFLGTTAKLRRYYDSDWTDVDGVSHLAGTPGSSTDFFGEIDCTLASNTVTVPAFDATPTETARINPNVREIWQLWDEAGTARNTLTGDAGWIIPGSPTSTTRDALAIFNTGQSLLWPPNWYLNALGVQQLIDAVIGLLRFATSVIAGWVRLSVPAVNTADPVAIGQNDPVIPAFVLHTSKYVSLNAAITAIASLGGGEVVVDASTPVTSNVATTASIALRVEGQGILTGTAKTITIVGPFECPRGHRTFAAGVTVSFAGNEAVPELQVSWWGADETAVGADTNSAIDAALTSLSTFSGGTLRFSWGVTYQVTGLTWTRCFSGSLIGIDSASGPRDLGSAPTIIYGGTNGGTILHCINPYKCMIKGIRFLGSVAGGAAGADVGIHLDQDVGGSPPISTRNTITANVIIPNSTRATWVGIKIANVSSTNNEQHIISHNDLAGVSETYGSQGGTGIYLGHVNVKEVVIEHNFFNGQGKGIDGNGGSCYSSYNAFTATGVAFDGPFSDATLSLGDHGEETIQILTGQGEPFTMLASRFANLRGGQAVSGTTTDSPVFSVAGAMLEVRGATLSSLVAFTDDFILSTTGTGRIIWKHNKVSGISTADLGTGLDTFFYSEDDVRGTAAIKGGFTLVGNNPNLFGATPDLATGGSGYSARYSFDPVNGPATTVTNFLNGFDGQVIILEGDVFTSLANNGNIKTASGATITPWGSSKLVVLQNNGGVWVQIGGPFGLAVGEGAVLTIASNTIAPTNQIHQVGAGLIKTITVPATFTSGTITLVPTAAFTYDATGNILGTGTAVIGRTMFATYSASTGKWSLSY